MRKKIKHVSSIIVSTLLLFIILEFSLSLFFTFRDTSRFNKKIEKIIAQGAYDDLDNNIVKDIHTELFNLESEWAPFTSYKLKAYDGKYNTIDSNGVRKTFHNNTTIDDIEPFKIFCLGGSTMYSTGARDYYSIPSELSKLITKNLPNKNIEISNFGCHGYNRSVENILLTKELLKNNIPDLVIFYDGVNDVITPYPNGSTITPMGYNNRYREFQITYNKSKQITTLFKSSHTNRLITFIQGKIFKTKPLELPNLKELPVKISDNYRENIKLTNTLAKNYGFKVFNFLQPVIFTKSSLLEVEKRIVNDNHYFEQLYNLTYQKIQKDSLLLNDSTFRDISHVFNNTKKPVYTDFCHTGEYANKLVAKEIFETIKEALEQ